MAEDWSLWLVEARKQVRLSRAELARRASLSPETVRAYEEGRRRPTIESLTAILDALKLDRTEGNRIRLALGFAPDSRDFGIGHARYYSVEDLQVEIERLPWPAFAANDMMELVVANRIAQKLWGVDLSREFLRPEERSFLRVVSDPRLARHVVNWEEAVGVLIALWKGHSRGPESLEAGSPPFRSALEHFLSGDPAYVNRFLDIWDRTPPHTSKIRYHYRVVWRDDAAGEIRFLCIQGPANEAEALGWHDWIPVDAESWQRLERLVS